MNYEQGIILFRSKNKIETRKRKGSVVYYTNREIMFMLSEIQSELGNRYRLLDKRYTLNLTNNKFNYNFTADLPKDLFDIISIEPLKESITTTTETEGGGEGTPVEGFGGYGFDYGLNYGGGPTEDETGGGGGGSSSSSTTFKNLGECALKKISPQAMSCIEKLGGVPTKYTVYGNDNDRILEINSLPVDGKLDVRYIARLDLFDQLAGTTESISFSDYDESKSGFGGSFKIPLAWHSLLIDGAIANLYPEMYKSFLMKVDGLRKSKPVYMDNKLKYSLGVQ